MRKQIVTYMVVCGLTATIGCVDRGRDMAGEFGSDAVGMIREKPKKVPGLVKHIVTGVPHVFFNAVKDSPQLVGYDANKQENNYQNNWKMTRLEVSAAEGSDSAGLLIWKNKGVLV